MWPWFVLAALLPLAWCCVEVLVMSYPPRESEPAEVAVAPDSGPPAPVVIDVSQDGTLAAQAGRTLPAKPDGWQKRPPCDVSNRDEEVVNGACYVRVPRRPPCKPAQYEYAGACFEAVAKARRGDTSVEGVPW